MAISETKRTLPIAKYGGSDWGQDGSGIPLIVKSIKDLRETYGYGPIVVVSTPQTLYQCRNDSKPKVQTLTNVGIDIGIQWAKGNEIDTKPLTRPFEEVIPEKHLRGSWAQTYQKEYAECKKIGLESLKDVKRYSSFSDPPRARVLLYLAGEIPAAIALSMVLRSQGLETYHLSAEEWRKYSPLVSDNNGNIQKDLSLERISPIVNALRDKIPVIAGYGAVTTENGEMVLGRGASDLTATSIAGLFALTPELFSPEVFLYKDQPVFSGDPSVVDKDLDRIREMSYREAELCGQYGDNKPAAPSSFRILEEWSVDVPVKIRQLRNCNEETVISRKLSNGKDRNVRYQIVVGKPNCAIVTIPKEDRNEFDHHFKIILGYPDYVDLSATDKHARYLFFDADYIREPQRSKDLRKFNAQIKFGESALAVVDDRMENSTGILKNVFHWFDEGCSIKISNAEARDEDSIVRMTIEDPNGKNIRKAIKLVHDRRRINGS